jgi:formate dehydrogenase alpha subunit
MTKEKTFTITIDNKAVKARQNQTILQAAKENGAYIPSLCALEHLPSYGACRLCVVEVDGIRGYPTSCTTPVEEGMVIRTETAELRTLRQEVLKLLLSEHPASCLFCQEQDSCKEYQGTIRKVGVITGCRYCPNDSRCELQQITEKVGLTETSYPVYYKNLPVEKYDPFYDRDYNLCILCGRCVRVCNDLRLNGTLSFKQRGRETTIGPAFGRNHIDAGCEFCGACVSVCPTGALSVKVSKWYGRPEVAAGTTCTYCPVGCHLLLQVKGNEVIDVLPDYDSPIDRGMICVKGRFAIPEYVQSPLRLVTPQRMTAIGYEDISWDQAIEAAAEKISAVRADDVLVVISPDLCNEDLFAAQQFARDVIGSPDVVSSIQFDLGDDLPLFLDCAMASAHFDTVNNADLILAVGLDTTYGYSPLGVSIKTAVQRGATLVTLGVRDSNLDIHAETVLKMDDSRWGDFLKAVVTVLAKGKEKKDPKGGKTSGADGEVRAVVDLAKGHTNILVLSGPDILGSPAGRTETLKSMVSMRDDLSWQTIVLHPYTNLAGMLAMGGLPGTKPGDLVKMKPDGKPFVPGKDFLKADLRRHRKVLYLVGEAPHEGLPSCDYLIYQNGMICTSGRQPDLILPASLFSETSGTVISAEGRLLEVRRAVEPTGSSRPDWAILSSIAERIRKGQMKYTTLASLQNKIKPILKGLSNGRRYLEFVRVQWTAQAGKRAGAVRSAEPVHDPCYRGIPLAQVVAGMKTLERRQAGGSASPKEKQ